MGGRGKAGAEGRLSREGKGPFPMMASRHEADVLPPIGNLLLHAFPSCVPSCRAFLKACSVQPAQPQLHCILGAACLGMPVSLGKVKAACTTACLQVAVHKHAWVLRWKCGWHIDGLVLALIALPLTAKGDSLQTLWQLNGAGAGCSWHLRTGACCCCHGVLQPID